MKTKQSKYGQRGYRFNDITGFKFGKLTAIELIEINKKGTYWKLKCDCGNFVTRLASNFKKKQHVHSCGCISKNPGKINAGFYRLYNDYKASATKRKYSFDLNEEQFKNLINQDCYYCYASPSDRYKKQVVHTLKANGLDRIDNNIGYNIDNCVPCCKICNKAKSDLTKIEFYNWIKKVYNIIKDR